MKKVYSFQAFHIERMSLAEFESLYDEPEEKIHFAHGEIDVDSDMPGYMVMPYEEYRKAEKDRNTNTVLWCSNKSLRERFICTEADEDFKNLSISDAMREYQRVKNNKEAMDRAKKDMEKLYNHIGTQLLPEMADDMGIDTVKVAGIGRLQFTSDIYCSQVAKNKDKLIDWLVENGYENAAQNTVNSSTLKSIVRALLQEGTEVPEDLVTYTPYTKASIVKA